MSTRRRSTRRSMHMALQPWRPHLHSLLKLKVQQQQEPRLGQSLLQPRGLLLLAACSPAARLLAAQLLQL
jgi:hypothetical protein